MELKDKNLYYIGGVVRDELLGEKSLDTDLTYVGDAIEYAKSIPNAKILQINEPFGTVRIKIEDNEVDIASTRTEIYPKKGHLPMVEKIGCSLKEDILRRDFTINAMAKSTFTGKIIDYTGGIKDLENKKLRILHEKSFIDDPTRIVRALKFRVRFGFELEENTFKLQKEYLANINYDMSYKRLKKELEETFNLNSQKAFEIFVKEDIYKLISNSNFSLPKVNLEEIIQKYNIKKPWIIYAGLISGISNLPLTKTERNIIENFKNIQSKSFRTDFEIYKAFENVPVESIIMFSTIQPEVALKYLDNLRHIRLSITGKDLQNMGINPSPKYQKCFDYILEKKMSDSCMDLSKEKTLAKDWFNNH